MREHSDDNATDKYVEDVGRYNAGHVQDHQIVYVRQMFRVVLSMAN